MSTIISDNSNPFPDNNVSYCTTISDTLPFSIVILILSLSLFCLFINLKNSFSTIVRLIKRESEFYKINHFCIMTSQCQRILMKLPGDAPVWIGTKFSRISVREALFFVSRVQGAGSCT